jgi:hypothetical protein
MPKVVIPFEGSLEASFACRPAMTRFVEVPIRVQVPPRIDANESGIRSFCALMEELPLAHEKIRGVRSATIGVLLRNADKIVTGTIMRICAITSDLGLPRSKLKRESRPTYFQVRGKEREKQIIREDVIGGD